MVSYARQEVLLRQRRMGPSKCCASRRRIFNGISHRNQMMSARGDTLLAPPQSPISHGQTGTENEGRDNDEKCDYPSHLSRMRATRRGGVPANGANLHLGTRTNKCMEFAYRNMEHKYYPYMSNSALLKICTWIHKESPLPSIIRSIDVMKG